jgi:hypothetical protein
VKKMLLVVLSIYIFVNAPWRLGALAAETLILRPGYMRVPNGNDRYWDTLDLEKRLTTLGWDVGYAETPDGIYGMTVSMYHVITVDETLPWNGRLAVLAHEAGHTQQPGWFDTTQGEVFAESVALLYARDGVREHARYLAKFKSTALLVWATEWRAIYAAAATLQ